MFNSYLCNMIVCERSAPQIKQYACFCLYVYCVYMLFVVSCLVLVVLSFTGAPIGLLRAIGS